MADLPMESSSEASRSSLAAPRITASAVQQNQDVIYVAQRVCLLQTLTLAGACCQWHDQCHATSLRRVVLSPHRMRNPKTLQLST